MNRPLMIATLGMAGTFALHLIGGEVSVHRPLLADAVSAEMDLYVSVLWHGITAVLAFGTVALAFATWSGTPQASLLWLVGGQTLGLGALFVLYGLIRTGSLWVAPQWIIILPLAAVILWCARTAPGSAAWAGRAA